uniref:Uncharacterized protein n=1 Tax=Anguilla anguilla TaxID=7936 RepID=A0A0E9TPN4_ANGAN
MNGFSSPVHLLIYKIACTKTFFCVCMSKGCRDKARFKP